MSWTREDLQQLVTTRLSDCLFIAVSNREPYVHNYVGNEVKCIVPASGLTAAIDPVMQACGGTWIAHGSGTADNTVVDNKNSVRVPPETPKYSLRRVWLTKEEEAGYYSRFSNETLWPLCHIVYERPIFEEADWKTYQKVNQYFADAVLDEIGNKKAFVFIQDYHLTLVAKMIKAAKPDIATALFWHIPWPNPEAFRICPWGPEILDGLLSNDLLGFHINYHRNNFMDTVERTMEAKIDREKYEIHRGNCSTLIKPFPISIDFEKISSEAETEAVTTEMDRIRREWAISDHKIGVGLDRIDYTKGIPDRFKAIDRLLTRYPEYINKIVFFQLGEPSRIHVKRYRELNTEIEDLAEQINWKYRTNGWKPIIQLKTHLSPVSLLAFRRLADFFIVSSLHDGMNLVAKEFVASRNDEDGVLLLSRFTGAAREMREAMLINPYATDEFAEKIRQAIEMPRSTRKRNMVKLRNIVKENNIYRWAGEIINDLCNC